MAKLKFGDGLHREIWGVALGLILLSGLLGSVIPAGSVAASPGEVKWSRVSMPTKGKTGNWVLAPGSDIQHLTQAIDGTLYCYANPSGTSYRLFKSTDEGRSWSYTGKVQDDIVDIAAAPDDASAIYYTTSSHIYKSTDAGSSFTPLLPNPGGAGSNNIEITSIDVAPLHSNNIIVVGTRDTDNSQFGGVYILDEEQVIPSWLDTNIGNYDVYAVALSPNFPVDRQIVAVVTDESDTIVTTKIGDADWGKIIGGAKLDKDNSGTPTPVAVDTSATIAFPSDYDATGEDRVLFVAIDAGNDNGDVYKVKVIEAPEISLATDLNIGSAYGLSNIDVTTLAITGDAAAANLLAGAATSTHVYLSTDGGSNWTRSTKEPTGQSKTSVLMALDFSSTGRAYAATSGTESAFSITQDGSTWNQVSLIDTEISNIVDLAPSPSYSQDNTLFMLTYGGEHSLWRSLNGGTGWERVYSSILPNVDSIKWVELPPQYGNGSQVVFLAGTGGGNPAIWKSTDSGQTFRYQATYDPDSGASFTTDIWAVVNDDTLFIGSHVGSNGRLYHTTDSGYTYSEGAIVGSHSLNSIVLSPNYDQDETILIGNTNGWVYSSNDDGTSFEPLPLDATSSPLTGYITVAFDPKFSTNNTVYAASDTKNKGIYRFIIGTSTDWESIDSTLPTDGTIGQLIVSADGTLHAINSQPVDTAETEGGMERCLNPTYSLGPTFETVISGLDDSATLSGLWRCDNQLWSTDTTNTMSLTDDLTLPVTLNSPPNKASGIGISNVTLEWEALRGATSYKWQLDYDTDFSSVPTEFEDETQASLARLPTLESAATTYYWRVRAIEPVLSPWSPKWSFTTSLGYKVTTPALVCPAAGASGVGLKPIFQWSAVAEADSYELLVSADVSFANPLIVKTGAYALPATAWQSDISLNYTTTYYWKVRASGSNSYSAWSAVGAFFTESPPPPKLPSPSPTPPQPQAPPEPPPPQPPPAQSLPPPQQTTPDWVTYLVGALLLTIVLQLIVILVLAIRRH